MANDDSNARALEQIQAAYDTAIWARDAGYEIDPQAIEELKGLIDMMNGNAPAPAEPQADAAPDGSFVYDEVSPELSNADFLRDVYGDQYDSVMSQYAEQDAAIADFEAHPENWLINPDDYLIQPLDVTTDTPDATEAPSDVYYTPDDPLLPDPFSEPGLDDFSWT